MPESRRLPWRLDPAAEPDRPVDLPEPIRPIPVDRTLGYVDPLGVRPGERLNIYVAAAATHQVSIQRLGRKALLVPDLGDGADRDEAETLATFERGSAARQSVRPGSYALVEDSALDRPATVSAWVRPWRFPTVNEVWNWAAIAGSFDFPSRCGWTLALDDRGRPGMYAGDGGAHDPRAWLFADVSLDGRCGEWIHLACTATDSVLQVFVDGVRVAVADARVAPARDASVSPVRLAAAAETGVVDHLLDADLTAVTLFSRQLTRLEVRLLAEDCALSDPEALGIGSVLAHWPLRERTDGLLRDASGNGHHARLVNGATLAIPGPAGSPGSGRPGYVPERDASRGGAVRFSSDDLLDCAWAPAASVVVPEDAPSGTYVVCINLCGSDEVTQIPFVVVRSRPMRKRSLALLYPTFTWTAYGRRPFDDVLVPGLSSSFYSKHLSGKDFFHLGMRMPTPRVSPYRPATHRPSETLHQHLVRPERFAEAWLEREGYSFECITDVELDEDPELLQRFAALMIPGHSEYWTSRMRDAVESYLGSGGAVVCVSGNTLFWRVSFDPQARSLEARKTSRPGEAVPWLSPGDWGERWHEDGQAGGGWSLIGQPASELLGMECTGWIDSGDAASFAPFTVVAPEHFLLHEPEEVPLVNGLEIGTECINGPAASGYEMDGLPEAVGLNPPTRDGRTHLAHAGYQPCVEGFTAEPGYGADIIYWERPDGGRVFNAGSIAYTGALAVDPGLQALTRNVLDHMGVARGESDD